MLLQLEPSRLLARSTTAYTLRLARDAEEVRQAQALRYAVFNLELHEGLEQSSHAALDADQFDPVCDHLIVEHAPTAEIVGTYRLQTGETAQRNLGYYSAQEFDFAPFEQHRTKVLELGRACVASGHRNQAVLSLLWRGISIYARATNTRYLIGCSSLTTQDPAVGSSAYVQLAGRHLAPELFRTKPLPAYAFPISPGPELARIPRLMSAYIAVGARICGEPAIDRVFKTIDFLTLLDLESLPIAVARKYLT
jgi:putative hemolysin